MALAVDPMNSAPQKELTLTEEEGMTSNSQGRPEVGEGSARHHSSGGFKRNSYLCDRTAKYAEWRNCIELGDD